MIIDHFFAKRGLWVAMITIFSAAQLIGQVAPQANYTFTSQAQLNAFIDGSTKYTSVTGSVTLNSASSTPFTDLTNLSELVNIGGTLQIINYGSDDAGGTRVNPLGAFSSLQTVGGNLLIGNTSGNNSGVTSVLQGSLSSIGGFVQIQNNASLDAISLSGLTEVTGGGVSVNNNSSLTNLSAVNLLSLAGNYTLATLPQLTTVATPNVATIAGSLRLDALPQLSSLESFSNVASLGGLVVRAVPMVVDLREIGSTVAGGRPTYSLSTVTIQNNASLNSIESLQATVSSSFSLIENFELLAVSSAIDFATSGTALSLIDIDDNRKLVSIAPLFNDAGTIAVQRFKLTDNLLLATVGSQPINTTARINIANNNGIGELPNLSATTALTQDLIISSNDALTDLSALSNIATLGLGLTVNDNDALNNLDGLTSLVSANFVLIDENNLLENLDGLEPLTTVTTTLDITNNAALGACCSLSCDLTVSGAPVDGTNPAVEILNNTGDCQTKSAFVAADCEITYSCAIAAPVEFLTFTGRLENYVVHLGWATATESNNSHFLVERSVDGGPYTVIGQIAGANDSQQRLDYVFADYDYVNAVIYYRLRQVDFDGTEAFSDVIAIDATHDYAQALTMYPNPAATSEVRLQLSGEWNTESIAVEVFASSGQRIQQRVASGNHIVLSTGHLQTGTYVVRVTAGGRSTTQRLIVR